MKMNSDKCHLFISGKKFEHLWVKIGNNRIWEHRTVKLLGITFNKELKLDKHLNSVCLKANRKISSLSKIKKLLDFNKIRVSFRPYFKYKFKCCPLT